jgi:hypothetical protein
MSFTEKFMKLPQKLRMVIVGGVLVVVAVPLIGLLIVLKNVLPEGKSSAASTAKPAAAAPAKLPAATSATPKKK